MNKKILVILALSLSALTGCSGVGTYKTPVTSYDKVKTALNGVEKSFKKITGSKKAIQTNQLQKKNKTHDDGLNSIFSQYTNDDIRGHSVEDLSYNEPPMVQFRCLKAVFEKVGNGFEFGTKYYDNITGDVYVDFTTGFKAEKKDEYKYAFNYELAMDMYIDVNNLISADVSFDITLSKNGQNYHTKWYVNLLLDYDMNNPTPNYTLTMLTENDETELPYYHHFTYEYDYVNVKDNDINEWRKFCMDSSQRLVRDNTHPSFDSYVNQGITYKVDYPKWFKNGNYYKPTQMSEERLRSVGSALFDDLELNATAIDADPFFAKQGTKNNVMQTVYKDFSKIYGDEIIYGLICRDEDDYNGQQQEAQPAGIRAMAGADTGAENLPVGGDMQIFSLFNGYIDPLGEKHVIELWYTDASGNALRRIENYQDLTYKFTTSISEGGNEAYIPVEVSLDTTIKEAYALLKRLNNFGNYSRQIILIVTDSQQVTGGISLVYAGEFDDNGGGNNQTATWPTEWSNYQIPEYKGAKVQYRFTRDGEHFWLYISNSNNEEADNYISILQSSGFEVATRVSQYNTTWKRKYSSNEMLMLRFDYSKTDYLIEAWTEPIDEIGGDSSENSEDSGNEEQTLLIYSLCLYGSFNDWGASVAPSHELNPISDNSFVLYQLAVQPGDKFKVVANSDWTIHNPETAYGGFGYDDFDNIKEYAEYFQKEDDKDATIIVKQYCEISVEAQNSGTHLGLRINVMPTGPKQ